MIMHRVKSTQIKPFSGSSEVENPVSEAFYKPSSNKIQLCSVAKSLLGLFNFVSLVIFAQQLCTLDTSVIKIHLLR